MKIDLHMHSTASDGTLSPQELVQEAIKQKTDIIALTDHDTTNGVQAALAEARNKKIEVIPGVEITIDDDKHMLYDIHLLGLFIDHTHPHIINLLKNAEKARETQKKSMVKKLQQLGYKISFSDLQQEAAGAKGRPHIAKILVQKNPSLMDGREVFNKLIGNGKPAYVPRTLKISLQQAISAIHHAGGKAFLAHPLLYEQAEKIIESFVEEKGDGLEVFYPYNKTRISKHPGFSQSAMVKKGLALGKQHDLLLTGGSDFHGNHRDICIGETTLPYEEYLKIQEGG